MNTPLAPWPQFGDDQIAAAASVLASGQVNSWTGTETNAFEEEFASWCGCRHAIATANGSLALSSAYLSIGIGLGDELITTPRTFIATASSAVLLGAKPVFADVDADSGAISAATIEPLITTRTKAIAVVHLGGWPADMPAILDLAQAHGIAVIEDCAQAHGARIAGQPVGSFGDVSAWSFCQDKILSTAGEGGMVTTNRTDLWDSIWALKDHGKTHEAVFGREHPPGFRWLHERFGSNFRLTELQSAIGRIQLEQRGQQVHLTRVDRARLGQVLPPLPLARSRPSASRLDQPRHHSLHLIIKQARLASRRRSSQLGSESRIIEKATCLASKNLHRIVHRAHARIDTRKTTRDLSPQTTP